jgi:hypothetical protein
MRKSPIKPIANVSIRRTPAKSTMSPAGIWLTEAPIDKADIRNPI